MAPVMTEEETERAKRLFFKEDTMPCCGKSPAKYYRGPEGGFSTNIKCFYCSEKWNICPPWFIEKID